MMIKFTQKVWQSQNLCSKEWNCKIHDVKIDKAEMRYRQIHKYSWKLQQSSHKNWQNNQKTSNYVEDLNSTINQQDLIDVYRTVNPTAYFRSKKPDKRIFHTS